jgi:hypothetical protein
MTVIERLQGTLTTFRRKSRLYEGRIQHQPMHKKRVVALLSASGRRDRPARSSFNCCVKPGNGQCAGGCRL